MEPGPAAMSRYAKHGGRYTAVLANGRVWRQQEKVVPLVPKGPSKRLQNTGPPGLSWGTGVSGPTGTLFLPKKLLHMRPHRIIAILPGPGPRG
ncbi:unnamed protein product [Arctogadus glacialis]